MKGIFLMLNTICIDTQICETDSNQQKYQFNGPGRGSKICRPKRPEYLNNSVRTETHLDNKKENLNIEFTFKSLGLLKSGQQQSTE